MRRKWSQHVFGLGIMAVLITACSKQHKNTSAADNTLRVDICAEIPTFDPALTEDWNTYRVINDLYAGLVDFDQSNHPIPGLASSWQISDDGLTYSFYLRPNLHFSDGTAITAADFVYSWQRLVNPKTGSPYAFLLKDVVNAPAIIAGKLPATSLGVTAPNSTTVQVKLAHPSSAFLAYLTTPNVFVVPPQVVTKYGESWTLPQHIVTSGAYQLAEHVVNGMILVRKNPYYYAAKQVKIAAIKYFPYVDSNASLANYKTGALDATCQTVPIDQYRRLQQQFPDELHTFKWERIDFLNFNMKLAKYANNPKLRQALTLAIDREDLTQKVLAGGQIPLYSVVTSTIEHGSYADLGYAWRNWPRAEQVALAQKLYHEAGYGPQHPLTITLKYQTNDLYKNVMLAIMAMWQEVLGVKVILVNEELKVLNQDWKNANFDMAQGRWGADYNSVTTYTPLFICNNGNNRSHYCNPRYDALIAKAEVTTNPIQQQQFYRQALQLVLDDYPIIPLYQPTHQRLVSPRVQGYQIESNYLDNVQSKWFSLR